jgi:hypothetical protein
MTPVNSGSQARDEHLRSTDFFDATRHHRQRHPRPRGLGLSWNLPLDGGGLLISREIRIEIDVEAVLQP